MKNIIVTMVLLVLSSGYLMSQTIRGHIYEENKGQQIPLIGATVQQAGTLNGVVADENGDFVIKLIRNMPKLLVFSFVGYVNDTIEVADYSGELKVVMANQKLLDEVVVTGRRKGASISRTETRSVVNITESELQKAACCNLSESFETSATVDVSYSDAVTGAKQIQMLGLAGIYTQLLTENIPNMRGLATPWGLGYIPGSWMSSIQVSKGTSSVINGYESMAGQINIEYKKTNDDEKFFLNLYGNHEGKVEGNANANFHVSKKWSTAVLAHVENLSIKHDGNGDSFVDMPLIDQVNLFNRWFYNGKNLRSRFGFKYLTENRRGGQTFYDDSKPVSPENGYGIGVKTNRYEGFLKIGYVSKYRAATSLGFQNQFVYHKQESFFGLNNYNAEQVSFYSNLMYQSWIGNSNHRYTSGICFNHDDYDEDLNDSTFTRTESVIGGFVQYTYSNGTNLNIITGLRLDHNSLFGLLFTPRLAVRYNLNEHNIIRASAGKGYRSPNVVAENTSLLATSKKLVFKETPDIESSWNYGLSYTSYIDINARELTVTADFFRTEFENQIVIDRENDPFFIYVYNLKGKSYSNSFQIEASYELFRNFETTLAFRYNDVKTTISGDLVQKTLVNKFKGLVAISYQTRKKQWQFDMNVQAIGNQRLPYTGFNPEKYQLDEYSPDFFVINAQITRYLNRFELYLGGENLGNYRQTDPIIASEDPFGKYFDSSIIWGPISGIKIYAGLRFTIKNNHEKHDHEENDHK